MARSFNGTSALIDAGTSSVLDPTGGLSLSAWFNPSTLTFPNTNTAYAAIGGRNDATSADRYIFYLKSSGAMGWYTGGVSVDPGLGTIGGAGTWNHAVLTSPRNPNNATAIGYLNGVVDTGAFSITNAGGGAVDHFQIGADNSNPGSFNFPGSIADVAVWNVVLTAAEAKALSLGARPHTIRPVSLVGYWPLDGLQSPEPDLSGNANNGTLTGTALAAGPPVMQFTPRWPQFIPGAAGGGSAIKFRKTLSQIGGRVGTRQQLGWGM